MYAANAANPRELQSAQIGSNLIIIGLLHLTAGFIRCFPDFIWVRWALMIFVIIQVSIATNVTKWRYFRTFCINLLEKASPAMTACLGAGGHANGTRAGKI